MVCPSGRAPSRVLAIAISPRLFTSSGAKSLYEGVGASPEQARLSL